MNEIMIAMQCQTLKQIINHMYRRGGSSTELQTYVYCSLEYALPILAFH